MTCSSPNNCAAVAEMASTASYASIGQSIFSYSARQGIGGSTYGFGSNTVRSAGSTGGLNRYTLDSTDVEIDGCYALVDFDVIVNWTDGVRTRDNLTQNKPFSVC